MIDHGHYSSTTPSRAASNDIYFRSPVNVHQPPAELERCFIRVSPYLNLSPLRKGAASSTAIPFQQHWTLRAVRYEQMWKTSALNTQSVISPIHPCIHLYNGCKIDDDDVFSKSGYLAVRLHHGRCSSSSRKKAPSVLNGRPAHHCTVYT